MTHDAVVNEKTHATALVLANAAELGATLFKRVAGNDISTAINGSVLTRDMIQSLIFRRIQEKLSQRRSAA